MWHLQRYTGESRFPLYDGIGSVRGLVNQMGTVTDTYEMDAFGVAIANVGATENPYRRACPERRRRGGAWGYLTDPSGMLQLGARFYWPEVGRFIQQDPIRDGMNWYAYAGSRPSRSVDADGRKIMTVWGLGKRLQDQYGGEDKLAHCVWTCTTVARHPFGRRVGTAVASAAGWLQERRSVSDPDDMIANGIGIHHGNELCPKERKTPQESCEDRCRCSLWDTGAAEVGIGDGAQRYRRR